MNEEALSRHRTVIELFYYYVPCSFIKKSMHRRLLDRELLILSPKFTYTTFSWRILAITQLNKFVSNIINESFHISIITSIQYRLCHYNFHLQYRSTRPVGTHVKKCTNY